MLSPTAQCAASIQYPVQICAPFFGEERGYEAPQVLYVARLADTKPETLIRTPTFISPRWAATPGPCSSDEVLSWDVLPAPEHKRPSGMIAVNLEYVGRGAPESVEGIWD